MSPDPTRPRLLFVVESGTDVRLVDGLSRRFDLTVLARRVPGGVEISREPENSVPTTIGPASRTAFARLVYSELLRPNRYDLALVQGYAFAALAANLAARRSKVPVSLLVCSPVERYYRQRREHPEPGKPYRRLEAMGIWTLARANARLARHYVVLSRHLESVVRSHGSNAAIDTIPVYGVDVSVFTPPEEPRAILRERRGLPETGAVIFFSSRVAPEKDAETLLAAMKQLVASGRDLWLLHRSGGYRQFMEVATRAGVGERVIATDAIHPVTELPLDYQSCDLVVQASREEGLGFSPLEGLACGTPVVATAVGGLVETIIDGQTGWTYPAGNADLLAQRIAMALDHPEEGARRAAAGRKMVMERFETTAAFDRLEDSLLSRLPPPERRSQ